MIENRHLVSFEHSVVPLHTLDPSGLIIDVSRSWLDLLGYRSEEVVGHPIGEFQSGAMLAGVVGRTSEGEFRFVRRDGRLIDVLVSERREQQGDAVWTSCALIDITSRKRTEAALLVIEERLRQAQKMEAIGRLAAGVAHDFNNILQSIIGALELVLDDVPAGTETREFVEVANRAAIRGSSLTNHLLSYARKQVLLPHAIELGPFLSDIRKLLARTLGPQIVIEVGVEQAPSTLADPGQLQTALLNLAINASHAMPQGGTLGMRAGVTTVGDARWAILAVSDTGVGMDAATAARAMEPFFTTKGVNGSGLGLSMVQGFAEQSGGALSIVSTPGRGTTVELRLPLAAQDDRFDRPGARPSAGRILLVDDSSDVLLTMSAFLVKAGFEVVRADNGTAALAVLARGPAFDALITDFAMPGVSGADLIGEGRLIQPGLQALIITGFAELSLSDRLPERTQVLHKPVQRQDLIAALGRLMGRAPGGVREPLAVVQPR